MKKTFVLLTLIFISFIFSSPSFGQSNHFRNKNLPCLDKKFTISLFWVNDSLNVDSTKTPNLTQAVEDLNKAFEPICVSFNICDTTFIDQYQFANLSSLSEFNELKKRFNSKFRINLYIVNNISYSDLGYTSFKSLKNINGAAIVISKTGLKYRVISHFMGTGLGLLTTNETVYGKELADGSNCNTAGDKICDTPADPNLPFNPNMNNGCRLVNNIKDPNGNYYTPDISNYMSFYWGCQCKFSYQQYKLMAENYKTFPEKLW